MCDEHNGKLRTKAKRFLCFVNEPRKQRKTQANDANSKSRRISHSSAVDDIPRTTTDKRKPYTNQTTHKRKRKRDTNENNTRATNSQLKIDCVFIFVCFFKILLFSFVVVWLTVTSRSGVLFFFPKKKPDAGISTIFCCQTVFVFRSSHPCSVLMFQQLETFHFLVSLCVFSFLVVCCFRFHAIENSFLFFHNFSSKRAQPRRHESRISWRTADCCNFHQPPSSAVAREMSKIFCCWTAE